MSRDYRHLFTKSLAEYKGLHFAAHSHHFWPDCVQSAYEVHWQDSIRFADTKWTRIFSEVLPEARSHISRILNTNQPDQIALAPNTHEFVDRILSGYVGHKKVRILSTDQEFYSFRRQAQRYAELPNYSIDWLPVEPYATFVDRLLETLKKSDYDLVFLSHVFFSSGFSIPSIQKIADAIVDPEKTSLVVDGYHSFMALPLDLKSLADRIYFMSGGYKYAMSGEGICFLHVPRHCTLRPLNTGWFAEYERLTQPRDTSAPLFYPNNHARFAGSTTDSLPAYRFNAVQRKLQEEGIDIPIIHAHVEDLKKHFVSHLEKRSLASLTPKDLLRPLGELPHSHFLTFKTERAGEICESLKQKGIYTDYRGDRLRFGFGLYHTRSAVDQLFK